MHETTALPLSAKLLGIELQQPDIAVVAEPRGEPRGAPPLEEGGAKGGAKGGGAVLGTEGSPAESEPALRSAKEVDIAERVRLIAA